jgi:hypothetical protein
MFYSVQIKSNGEELSRWKTREEAEDEVQRQEAEDKENGNYESDYYCIEEKSIYHIVVCQYILPWREAYKIKDFREFEKKFNSRNSDTPVIMEATFDNLAEAQAAFEFYKKHQEYREVRIGGGYNNLYISWQSIELCEENDVCTTDNIDFACAEYRED